VTGFFMNSCRERLSRVDNKKPALAKVRAGGF
jgi:hypothetical protein